ncbi:MAG: glutathione synthase [Thermodesulfobacteriota bacterium]|nr:glutathione synthase [Thermodesulfobacteriota bacterium]
MKVAFLMDRLEHIDPEYETTSYIMYECNKRGHSMFFLEPHDIYVRAQKVVARMDEITVHQKSLPLQDYWQKVLGKLEKKERLFKIISEMDVLFLRKDPPLSYKSMEFLAPVKDKLFMINDPAGVMIGNSKLYCLNFPELIPETHISRDPERIKRIIDNFGGDMIIKPLDRFGGQGIIKVSTKDQDNLNSLIHYYVSAYRPYPERETIMVQEYLKEVRERGDVRILMLNGKILGAMARKASDGGFRTNIHAGGRPFKHEITEREEYICQQIGPKLAEDGLLFVGIDVIGEKLMEVNCVSPGGIPRINELDHIKIEAEVMDFVEEMAGK